MAISLVKEFRINRNLIVVESDGTTYVRPISNGVSDNAATEDFFWWTGLEESDCFVTFAPVAQEGK